MHSKLTKFLGRSPGPASRLLHILLFITFTLFSVDIYGQQIQNYVRIELTSGLVIEGVVIKIDYQNEVQVLVMERDTLAIPWQDIASLNFIDEEIQKRSQAIIRPKKANIPFRDSGRYFLFDFGIPLGRDHYGYPVAGGSVMFGYGQGFGYKHHVAATLGYDAYLWPDMTVLPLGFEYYGRLKETGRSWFYFFGSGYSFPHVNEYDWFENSDLNGGPFFNPGLGITNKRSEKRSWYLKFGYKYQEMTASYTGIVWEFGSNRTAEISEKIKYHRVDIRFGLRLD